MRRNPLPVSCFKGGFQEGGTPKPLPETGNWEPETGLRIFPVEPAKRLGRADFAAGQGHGLKCPFVAEFRLDVRLLDGPASIARKLLRARVLLSHGSSLPFIRQAENVRGCLRCFPNQTNTDPD